MNLLTKKNLLIFYTFLHISGYYLWIFFWKGDHYLNLWVLNTLSILGPTVASISLLFAYKKSKEKDRYLWLLLAIGCINYVIGEAVWNYYELILRVKVPFPGWPDLFYMFQIIFYLFAFTYKIWVNRGALQLFKFIFDTSTIMIVAIATSWNFLIKDIINQEHVSHLFLLVSIGYPIGDLILLFGVVSFYFGSDYFFPKRVLQLILTSLSVQVFADSIYLFLSAKDIYISGSLLDPLWSLALLLMGIAGAFNISDYHKQEDYLINKKENKQTYSNKGFFSLKLLISYFCVILLFIMMVSYSGEINSLIVGTSLAILLIIFRQIFTLWDNHKLLYRYYKLNEVLEQRIHERTEELREKNQQLVSAVQEMEYMAYHDVLSGLPNRRLFVDRLDFAMKEAKYSQYQIAVIFIDLDRFKNINDTLGHEFGDLVLKHVSNQMLENIRGIDTISRQGGDEFTILLNHVTDKEEIIPIITRLLAIIATPFTIRDQEINISMSVGIALFPQDGNNSDELLKHADIAMYQAKADGGNTYKFYSSDINLMISRKISLENGLRKAILQNEFILHYQPQINLERNEVVGIEALIRWDSNDAGIISPAEFIPLAEETRLILPIGEWVLYTACKQAKIWHSLGHHHIKIAVNLSPLQFLHEDLVDTITSTLEKTGLNPSCLEIEITESVAVLDAEEAIIKMHQLKKLGVQIAIDDFGTGYSSLNYLKRFPINTLKIAQQFIKDINKNNSDKALVDAMISVAHNLGLSVIAEGVETVEQLEILKDLKCDEIQGYIYSKPLPSDQFTTLLEDNIPELI